MKRLSRPLWKRPRHRVNIVTSNGRLKISGLDAWYLYWRDPYHLLLTVPWLGFWLIVGGLYLGLNALFAGLYLLGRDAIANATPGSFWDAFFFSVQTFASIGYGAMYPQTFYANTLVTLEAIVSIVGIALLTGLAFARFTRSTARIMFSQNLVVMPFQNVPTLMVRAANQRRNYIREGQVHMYLLCDEWDDNGHIIRRFHELLLLRNRNPSFVLSWTVMHPIDANSPFYGETVESLTAKRAEILVMVQGVDGTISQPVYANHSYSIEEILWDHKFIDILYVTPDGQRYLDFQYFHNVEPLMPRSGKTDTP